LAGSQPPLLYPPCRAPVRRAPSKPLLRLAPALSDLEVPVCGWWPIGETDNDLTRQHANEPQVQRIIVAGRVTDEDGRAVPGALIELWQANAAGRYHAKDDHPAPLDPNFTGAGRTVTDTEGRYRFVTIKPGAYPWAESRQRMATGAHSFLVVRLDFPDTSRHANVLSRRSAIRLGSDVSVDP
jgi:protocatechuate 3,4-dioxygenase beta subunit